MYFNAMYMHVRLYALYIGSGHNNSNLMLSLQHWIWVCPISLTYVNSGLQSVSIIDLGEQCLLICLVNLLCKMFVLNLNGIWLLKLPVTETQEIRYISCMSVIMFSTSVKWCVDSNQILSAQYQIGVCIIYLRSLNNVHILSKSVRRGQYCLQSGFCAMCIVMYVLLVWHTRGMSKTNLSVVVDVKQSALPFLLYDFVTSLFMCQHK